MKRTLSMFRVILCLTLLPRDKMPPSARPQAFSSRVRVNRRSEDTGPSALHRRPLRKPCMCLFHPSTRQEQHLELNMINVPTSELKLSGPLAPGLTLNPRKAQHEVRDLPQPGKGLQPAREDRDCQSSTRSSGRIRHIVLSPPRRYR